MTDLQSLDCRYADLGLVTALHDPDNTLLPKAERLWELLASTFGAIAVHCTADTPAQWLEFLADRGVPVNPTPPPANWDHIGMHRRGALRTGLDHGDCDRYLYVDPDHILRWIERAPDDLHRTLDQWTGQDGLIVGRSPTAMAATPKRLRDTEAVVNEVYRLISGERRDLMMAVRGFTRQAAQHLVDHCDVDSIGNDVDWPLRLAHAGYNLLYLEADGLRYETNHVYVSEQEDQQDQDPQAWMLRVYTANQHIDAMRPWLPVSGTNGMSGRASDRSNPTPQIASKP